MYNNFSSKKTKKVISALLASALVVTSAPITADAATTKVLGVSKTFSIAKKASAKVSGLSKAEKKIVKVTISKNKKKVTVKGKKAGTVKFKVGSKSYTVRVTKVTSIKKKTFATTLTAKKNKNVSVTVNGTNVKYDKATWTSSNKNVVKVASATTKISSKKVASNTLKPLKKGTATITVKSKATGKSLKVKVTVKAATTATATPSVAPTATATGGAATATPSVAPTATATATGSATTTPSAAPTATVSGGATTTPSAAPTATVSGGATTTPSATPEATTAAAATATPTVEPTKTPEVVTGGTITVTGAAVTTDAAVKVVSGTTVVYEGTVNGLNAKKLDAGTYVVTVSKDGYETATATAVVVDKEATTVTVELVETATVVSKVYDVTTTTVSVEMKAAAATTPSADTFKVLVNGTANTVKTVTKAVGDTTNTKFVLTLTDSLNKKEGTLTVNGTSASLAGSDFDFDFKAPTATVNVINSTTIDVVFSEKVSKSTAETITNNYQIKKLSDSAVTHNIAAAVLQADGKTVRLILSTPNATDKNLTNASYVLVLNHTADANNIVDLAKNAVAANSEVSFTGTADADTEAPELISASYDASEDKLYFNFTEAMSGNFVQNGFTITDGTTSVTLNTNDTASWSANKAQLVVTLGTTNKTALKAMGTNKKLSIKADSVKDVASNGITLVSDKAVSEKTVLKTASYDEATNYLTLTFSNPVDVSTLDLTDITLGSSAGTVTLDSNDTVKTTTDGTTVEIELAKDTGLDAFEGKTVTNRVITLATGSFNDTYNVAVATSTNLALTYVEDTTAPQIESVDYNATTKRLTIKFTEPVQIDDASNNYKIDDTKISFVDGEAFTLTQGDTSDGIGCEQSTDSTDGVATSSKVVSFVHSSDTLTEKSKIYFGEGAFVDDAGNKLAEVTKANALSITYVNQTGPTVSNVANNGTSSVIVTFDHAVTKETAENVANYSVYMSTNETVKIAVTDAKLYASGTKVRLKLATEPTNGIGYSVKVSNIVDKYNNPIQTGASAIGSFAGTTVKDTTAPTLTGTVGYTDTDGSKSVSAGDKLTLTFTEVMDIDFSKIDASDFALTAGSSLGTAPSFAYGDSRDQVVITLGANPNLTLGTTTIDVATQNDLKDEAEKIAAQATALIIPVQGVAPQIKTATYEDTNKDGLVSKGDKVSITYTQNLDPTGIANIDASNLTNDFTISNSGKFVDTTQSGNAGYVPATFEIANGNQIVVTLGTGADIVPGTTTIDEGTATSSNIKDTWGVAQGAADSTTAIIKSDDETAPYVLSATVTKASANSGNTLEAGDKVVLTLSEAAHLDTFEPADFIFYQGATQKAYGASDSTNVTVSSNTVTITIAASDGWVGTAISSLTTFNVAGGATSIADASGNAIVPVAGFGVTVTK